MINENPMVSALSNFDQAAFDIFDQSPSVYIDASWFGFIENGVVLRRLVDSRRATESLSRIVSNRFKIERVSASELSDPIVFEVYMANSKRLRLLVWALGLLVYSDEVRHCVNGQLTRCLIDNIGTASYRFALLKLNNELPVASAERCSLLSQDAETANYGEKIIRAGLRVLAPFFLTQGEALNRRISLKFPVSWVHQIAFPFESVDAARSRKLIELILQDPLSGNPPISAVDLEEIESPLDTNFSSSLDVQLPIANGVNA